MMSNLLKMAGIRTFLTVVIGQFVSTFGTGLTNFSLGIWILKDTGSVTYFAIINLVVTLPGILVAPLAGVIVDRFDRRRVMLLSDCGSGLCILSLALLIHAGHLHFWHVCVALGINSCFAMMRAPAFSASIPLLVPKEHLGRASGVTQIGQAASGILAPMIAGLIVQAVGLDTVVLVDFLTYTFAIAMLLMVYIPKPPQTTKDAKAGGSFWRKAGYGLVYIKSHPGLRGLLIYFAAIFFSVSIANVLMAPMMLKFASVAVIGFIISCAGAGLLTGSLVMSAWGGPKTRINGIFAFGMIQALAFIVMGLRPDPRFVGAGLFLQSFTLPFIQGCNRVIWQTKTPPDVQGRVFAASSMVIQIVAPIGYVIAGPMADRVFEPLLSSGGSLAHSIGQLIGVGPGRGIGLMLIVMGFLNMTWTVSAFMRPRIRYIEAEIPDAIDQHIFEKKPLIPDEPVKA
ncbi:MAG TPA: MFS transporter [Pyrinomonadaceae bacterium]|nr:MFS transporter [Pyrinomonadaceae bacterium]